MQIMAIGQIGFKAPSFHLTQFISPCNTVDSAAILELDFPKFGLTSPSYDITSKSYYTWSHTIWGQRSLLCGTGQPGGPEGGMSSLGSSPQFGEGQGLAVVSQRVLLQMADGHGGEGARQTFVCVLLAWKLNKNKQESQVSNFIKYTNAVLDED